MNEAEAWVKKAIEANKRHNTMFWLGKAHALYAELLKRKGDLSGAKENPKKAVGIYQECGADGWMKKAEADLTPFSSGLSPPCKYPLLFQVKSTCL